MSLPRLLLLGGCLLAFALSSSCTDTPVAPLSDATGGAVSDDGGSGGTDATGGTGSPLATGGAG